MKNNLFKFIDLDNFKDIIKLKRKILFSKICFERDDIMKKRIAVISVMMENAKEHQVEFNNIVANFQQYIYGRMGLPFHNEGVSVVSIIMLGTMDEINAFTGKLGSIPEIQQFLKRKWIKILKCTDNLWKFIFKEVMRTGRSWRFNL